MTKKKLLAPLFLAASFLIVGCSASEIVARPQWIDDPIVEKDKEKYKDNTLKEIYDAIKKLGDTNANVLNKVMYDIAQQHIGPYEDVLDEKTHEPIEIGLKTIISGQATEEQFKAFVEKHQIYKADEFGFTKNGETVSEKTELNEDEKRTNSLIKIINQFNRIKEDICKKLFDEIKGGTYSTKLDKFFEEEYFIEHLYKEMYDVGTYPVTGELVKDAVFFPKKVDETWVDYVNNKFLHVFKDSAGSLTDYYSDYVNRKVLPEIYRTLLIETYVREQRETNLGRSYARKINMITVPKTNDSYTDTNIEVMLDNYARDNLITATNRDLEPIKDAMVGFATKSPTVARMLEVLEPKTIGDNKIFYWKVRTDNNGKPVAGPSFESTPVYRGTKLYDIVDKYLKLFNVEIRGGIITPTRWDDFNYYPKEHLTSDEQAAYDDLTNKGAYTLEKGLEIKEREIRLTDMTTDGWFLKSTGVSGLDQTFSDRLFNITTARIIDNDDYKKRTDTLPNDTARYFKGTDAYLFKNNYDRLRQEDSIILNGDSNFYIVQIEEAASASKLSVAEEKDSYLGLKATATLGESNDAMNEIVSKITEQVANSDTYKKNAEQYYLMISNIVFYDQSVYDYFKSQFPDLFK